MNIAFKYKGDTLVVSPLKKRDRLPESYLVVIEDGISYAAAIGEKIQLGMIPPGYTMVSKDKYEIIYKTSTPPRRSKKRYKK